MLCVWWLGTILQGSIALFCDSATADILQYRIGSGWENAISYRYRIGSGENFKYRYRIGYIGYIGRPQDPDRRRGFVRR